MQIRELNRDKIITKQYFLDEYKVGNHYNTSFPATLYYGVFDNVFLDMFLHNIMVPSLIAKIQVS